MSLGPLTAYTPSSACEKSLGHIFLLTNGILVQGPASTDACFPANYKPQTTNFYSPGTCPLGYTAACSSVNVTSGTTQTFATCCPAFMTCQSTASFAWESTLRCKSEIGVKTTAILTVTPVTNLTGTVMSVTGALNAYAYLIHYQETETTTTSSLSTATTTPTSSPTVTSATETSTPTASSISSGSGLTKGAIAGIAVGAVVGGVLLCALAVATFLWKRKKNNQGVKQQVPYEISGNAAKESQPLAPQELPPNYVLQELDGTSVARPSGY